MIPISGGWHFPRFYQDLKSLELATEQQAKRVAEIEARRSQSRIDEMALVRHLRKHALRQV